MTAFDKSALPTYGALAKQSWPIILANSTVPLLGLVDAAVIGHFGSVQELAALALATLIFSFVYWGFGFLRMGTTGFVARAHGADNLNDLRKVIVQSSVMACIIAITLLLVHKFILSLSLDLLAAPESTIDAVSDYFNLRVWGAPATLLQFVFTGVFIGLGASRKILWLQLCLNVINIVLDIVFAGIMDMGIHGIALGTIIAEYITVLYALFLLSRHFPLKAFFSGLQLHELRSGWKRLLVQNGDIFVRTLFLLLGFSFFARVGASFGEVVLAANHVLLQYVAFCAFFLDGYAYVLESHVGNAYGKRSKRLLQHVLNRMLLLSGATAVVLALTILIFGTSMLSWLTDKELVIEAASNVMPLVALYVLMSVLAYQLDGAFIGAGYGSAMRNCSIVSTLILIASWYWLFERYEEKGLWYAFIVYVLARGISLLLFLPKLKDRCGGAIQGV